MNKILIGNKSDWTDKRAVTEDQGRELADELGIKFMETSAKVNEGVEEAFFTLARLVTTLAGDLAEIVLTYSSLQRLQDPPHRLSSRCRRIPGWSWKYRWICKSQPARNTDYWRLLFMISVIHVHTPPTDVWSLVQVWTSPAFIVHVSGLPFPYTHLVILLLSPILLAEACLGQNR